MDEPKVNFDLLDRLATKDHPLLNIADDLEEQIRQIPAAWVGEVFQEARTSHHLLDMVGIPHRIGNRHYTSGLDARTYQAVEIINALRGKLDRIRSWHTRETGPGGTVGDFCVECGCPWPCDTRQLVDGTYTEH